MTASSTGVRLGAIAQISLSIRDVARAEHFYGETLGLPHVFTFGDLAFFDADGTRLYLHRKDEADWRPELGPLLPGRRHPCRPGAARRARRQVHRRAARDLHRRRDRRRGVDDLLRRRRGQHACPHVPGAAGLTTHVRVSARRPRTRGWPRDGRQGQERPIQVDGLGGDPSQLKRSTARRRAARPITSRVAASAIRALMAPARLSSKRSGSIGDIGSSGRSSTGTRRPVSPSTTTSGMPPTADGDDGRLAGRGLEVDDPERLVHRRAAEHGRVGVELARLLATDHLSDPDDVRTLGLRCRHARAPSRAAISGVSGWPAQSTTPMPGSRWRMARTRWTMPFWRVMRPTKSTYGHRWIDRRGARARRSRGRDGRSRRRSRCE